MCLCNAIPHYHLPCTFVNKYDANNWTVVLTYTSGFIMCIDVM